MTPRLFSSFAGDTALDPLEDLAPCTSLASLAVLERRYTPAAESPNIRLRQAAADMRIERGTLRSSPLARLFSVPGAGHSRDRTAIGKPPGQRREGPERVQIAAVHGLSRELPSERRLVEGRVRQRCYQESFGGRSRDNSWRHDVQELGRESYSLSAAGQSRHSCAR